MAHDVFISYSSKDKHVADAMCNKLESNSIRCWMAPRDIRAGMDWGGAIMHAIKNSQVMVLVFSANANASQPIKREVERAMSNGVMVVPFRIEDVQPSDSLEFYLSTSHWLDALPPPIEQHLQRLVDDVKELMPMLPERRVVSEDVGTTVAGIEEKIEAELRAIRAREVETAGRIAEEAARRRDEERAQERQEAEKHEAELTAIAEAVPLRAAEEGVHRPAVESVAATITNRVGIEFVWIPPGSFMMGSENGNPNEKPVHQVTIAKDFYMGKYDVTQAQWQQVMGTTIHQQKDKLGEWWLVCGEGANYPMYYVSWDEAIAFIDKLNTQNDAYTYRLPSEAEWEYAARAGTTGDYAGDLDAQAWYVKNSGSAFHPVGGKQPNAFGLFDMQGNMFDWCADWYHHSYVGAPTDGSAWISGGEQERRVLRGGSYSAIASLCRSASRTSDASNSRGSFGLRVVAVARAGDATELSPELRAGEEKAAPLRVAEEIVHRPAVESVAASITNRIGMEFVWIPPGSFMMGTEYGSLLDKFTADTKPVHQVTFSKGFYMSKYQVTQAQWQQVMKVNPSRFKGENLPVEHVDWAEAVRFKGHLNDMKDAYGYRVPSEAEWEYACRAGTTGEYAGDLDLMAWYGKNSAGKTHPVGGKQPNAFGLFDMHGNVWEWVQDWYRNSYAGPYADAPTDGSAWLDWGVPTKPTIRVVRGGSWRDKAHFCRSAYRFRYDPDWRIFSYVGLRIVAVARTYLDAQPSNT